VIVIKYRSGALLLSSIGLGLFAACVWRLYGGNLLGNGVAAFAALVASAMALRAFGDKPALVADRSGLTVRTLYRTAWLPWEDVADIDVCRTDHYFAEFLRVASHQSLVITRKRANFPEPYRLFASFLALGKTGAVGAALTLLAARQVFTQGDSKAFSGAPQATATFGDEEVASDIAAGPAPSPPRVALTNAALEASLKTRVVSPARAPRPFGRRVG
jgi:hypothetical protein